MKKILVTGATGFVGDYLIKHLLSTDDCEIVGTSLTDEKKDGKLAIKKVDLTDGGSVSTLIEEIHPDYIYHLAALTSPSESFKNPAPTVLGNIQIQLNILNGLKEANLSDTRLLVVSSSEIYGKVDAKDLPIDEDTPMHPLSPYAVSKLTQDFLALQYSISYKMDILRVRPFNHTGPGQTPVFVVPAFAKQIALIEKGQQEPVMKVGNLEAERDFTDVRDMVRAYQLLMQKGEKGEAYNIGSGKTVTISFILDKLLSFSTAKIKVEKDPERFLPIEIPKVVCDFSKMKSLTGWTPEIPLEKTLQDTLDYWRSIV